MSSTYQAPSARRSPDTHIRILVLLALLAIFLRLPWFHRSSLSLDEAFTLEFTKHPWPAFWGYVAIYDIHPPLFYAIVKLFRVLGDSEWALRLPSFIFSVACIPLFYLAGRVIGGSQRGRPLGLAVAAIYCTSTLQLSEAQNARSYTLFVLAGAMAFTGLAWVILHSDRYEAALRGRGALKPLGIGAMSAIGLALLPWTHNIGLLFAAAFGVSALLLVLARDRRIIGGSVAIAVIGVAALLLWSPNLPSLLQQISSVSHGTWIKPVSARELSRILLTVYGALRSTSGPLMVAGLVGSAILALAGAAGIFRMWRAQKIMAIFCLSCAFLPLVGSVLFSLLVEPILLSRTLLPSLLPWSVIVSYGMVEGPRKKLIGWSVFLVLALNAGAYFFLDQEQGEPWTRIIREASSDKSRKAIIITVPNSSELPLRYYNEKLKAGLVIKPIPAPFPAVNERYLYPSGELGVPAIDDGMIQDIQRIIDGNSDADIWVVLRGHGTYDRSNRIGRLFDEKYCYVPIETGLWYMHVFKVINKTAKHPESCDAHWAHW